MEGMKSADHKRLIEAALFMSAQPLDMICALTHRLLWLFAHQGLLKG